jgi:hypothetical protein
MFLHIDSHVARINGIKIHIIQSQEIYNCKNYYNIVPYYLTRSFVSRMIFDEKAISYNVKHYPVEDIIFENDTAYDIQS